MGEFQQYFDIILFAMVALFLVLRLRSVLGRRTGNEQRRDPLATRASTAADKVVALPTRPVTAPIAPARAADNDGAATGLARIRGADPAFDPGEFLQGAKGAFE